MSKNYVKEVCTILYDMYGMFLHTILFQCEGISIYYSMKDKVPLEIMTHPENFSSHMQSIAISQSCC